MLSFGLFSRQFFRLIQPKNVFLRQDVFQIDPRYRKMDTYKRARYRKEAKVRLLALSCIYLAFTAWWIIFY